MKHSSTAKADVFSFPKTRYSYFEEDRKQIFKLLQFGILKVIN